MDDTNVSATKISDGIFSSGQDAYGTFWRRLLARFLDGLIFAPLTLAGHFIFLPGRGIAVTYAWNFITISAYWIYCALMHARYGQTLGKKAASVKVFDVSEGRIPDLEQAFLREIAGIITSALWLMEFAYYILATGSSVRARIAFPSQILNTVWIWWLVIELGTMLANTKRRAIHDFIARTVVLRIDGR
jgi:uncharacterized RDD family membrane protein YckC